MLISSKEYSQWHDFSAGMKRLIMVLECDWPKLLLVFLSPICPRTDYWRAACLHSFQKDSDVPSANSHNLYSNYPSRDNLRSSSIWYIFQTFFQSRISHIEVNISSYVTQHLHQLVLHNTKMALFFKLEVLVQNSYKMKVFDWNPLISE